MFPRKVSNNFVCISAVEPHGTVVHCTEDALLNRVVDK